MDGGNNSDVNDMQMRALFLVPRGVCAQVSESQLLSAVKMSPLAPRFILLWFLSYSSVLHPQLCLSHCTCGSAWTVIYRNVG